MSDNFVDTPDGKRLPLVPKHVTKEIFRNALKATVLMLVALLVFSLVLGWLVAGREGIWAALLGVAITAIFSGATIVSMLVTVDATPATTAGVILGGWLGKMVLLVISLTILKQMTFYDQTFFGIVLLVGVLLSAGLDLRSVIKGRQPYVTVPEQRS